MLRKYCLLEVMCDRLLINKCMALLNEKFPWLCNTIKTEEPSCAKQSGSNVADNDEALEDSVTIEGTSLYGLKFTYYVLDHNTAYDEVYGEDQLEEITRAFYFKGYIESIPPNVRTYQLQGIWGSDIVTMYVSRLAFKYYSTYGGADRNTPKTYEDINARIGDLVYLSNNNTLYEIVDVKLSGSSFGLSLDTYTITMRVYKDTKATIADNETIPKNDVIYDYASYPESSDKMTDDVLKINDEVSTKIGDKVTNFDYLWKDED